MSKGACYSGGGLATGLQLLSVCLHFREEVQKTRKGRGVGIIQAKG